MDEVHEFQLSAKELGFLRQLALRDKSLAGLLSSHAYTQGRRMVIRLNRAEVEQLRNDLTIKLAEGGFDENYFPNEQGAMLEQLIDTFFLR
jgi:hypothetical protein